MSVTWPPKPVRVSDSSIIERRLQSLQSASKDALGVAFTVILSGFVLCAMNILLDDPLNLFTSEVERLDLAANKAMLGHIVKFSVACPDTNMSEADKTRWVQYTAAQHWTAYPQAGTLCVDP